MNKKKYFATKQSFINKPEKLTKDNRMQAQTNKRFITCLQLKKNPQSANDAQYNLKHTSKLLK